MTDKVIMCEWDNCKKKAVYDFDIFGLATCSKHHIIGTKLAKEALEWQEKHPKEAQEQFINAANYELDKLRNKKQLDLK